MFFIKKKNSIRAINSNIADINREALLYTEYSWVRSDNIHIKNVEQCEVIAKGHICTFIMTAQVQGTWVAGDANPWILGHLPVPLIKAGFQFCGYAWNGTNGSLPIRFIVNGDGWLKPWYNHPDPIDGTIFVAYCSYITA